ncbi:MAG: tripartite tricarboxylate transporter substrate binding protein [Burkholderiales bacterium]
MSAQSGAATDFPAKGRGIRVVIPFPPGGGNDVFARFLVHGLNEGFAPGSVADNRGGAGTVIGTEIAAKGNPDGHTLLIVSVPFVVMNALYPDIRIDTLKDFTPVINAGTSPSMMLVGAGTPYKNVKDLMEAARAKPGVLAYATSGNGSSTHLIMELFKLVSKTDLVHVPYKGSGPAMTALMAGQVPVMFNNPTAAAAFIKAGRVRALGVSAPVRLKAFPDVPTMAEAGVPGCEGSVFWGVAAPAGTPKAVVTKLNTEFNRILASSEIRKHFASQDVDVAGGSPEAFGEFLRKEVALWGKVVRDAKIKAE